VGIRRVATASIRSISAIVSIRRTTLLRHARAGGARVSSAPDASSRTSRIPSLWPKVSLNSFEYDSRSSSPRSAVSGAKSSRMPGRTVVAASVIRARTAGGGPSIPN